MRKGEKGIVILAPVLCKVKAQQEISEQRQETDAQSLRRLVGFRTAYVFDVAQTEGEELPQFASVKGDPAEHVDALKRFVNSRGLTLDYEQAIAPARGISRGGRITLLAGLSLAEELPQPQIIYVCIKILPLFPPLFSSFRQPQRRFSPRLALVIARPERRWRRKPPLALRSDELKIMRMNSIYCIDCICGRHFEIESREFVCPACRRRIVIEWGHNADSDSGETSAEKQPTSEAVA